MGVEREVKIVRSVWWLAMDEMIKESGFNVLEG
jgi:hypothetical protein